MTPAPAPQDSAAPPQVDVSVAHPARLYDYLLGGKDNFAPDRALAEQVKAAYPHVGTAARQNREFLGRVVAELAAQGIDQFLDIGTGLPTAGNTHSVAQAINPAARIVCVDNDPIVMAHARALLTSSPEGATAYIHADLREPDEILSSPVLASTLDLTRPVAVLVIAVLHFIYDTEDPYGIVRSVAGAMPDGSYLALTHATFDHQAGEVVERLNAIRAAQQARFQARSRDEFAAFVDGLDLVPPGIVSVVDWPAADDSRPSAQDVGVYGVVARIRK